MNISQALKEYEASRQSDKSLRITLIFAVAAAIVVMVVFAYCNLAAQADPYSPRQAPGPIHGGNPHGGNPHWAPSPDPDLPANQHGRDPYDGSQHNDKSHPNRPYPF
jgi:hypothetical protein